MAAGFGFEMADEFEFEMTAGFEFEMADEFEFETIV
jgi:hypothetical protein